MPASPLITLTATFNDITGESVGSTSNPSQLIIRLCNFGAYLPNIMGTAMLAQIDQTVLSTTGDFSTLLWANDQITPSTTFYAISVVDGEGRVVQTGVYQFNAEGSATAIDLSDATQVVDGIPALFGDVATGTLPGYTVLLPRAPLQMIGVFLNGAFIPPSSYTLQGPEIITSFELRETDNIFAVYIAASAGAALYVPGNVRVDTLNSQIPGSTFTLSKVPQNGILLGLFNNGLAISPSNQTVEESTLTLTFEVTRGTLYAVYFAS